MSGIDSFFANGRIEPWINGHVLEISEMNDATIMKQVARKIGRLHGIVVGDGPERSEPKLWNTINEWMTKALNIKFNPSLYQKKNRDLEALKLSEKIVKEVSWLKEKLDKLDSPIVFIHGDINNNNIIVTPSKENECLPKISIIDYEYAGYYEYFE